MIKLSYNQNYYVTDRTHPDTHTNVTTEIKTRQASLQETRPISIIFTPFSVVYLIK